MTNVAILFSRDNIPKILTTESIAPDELEQKAKTHGPDSVIEAITDHQFYFCPDYTSIYGYRYNGWSILRDDHLAEHYDFDPDLIQTEFTELHLK